MLHDKYHCYKLLHVGYGNYTSAMDTTYGLWTLGGPFRRGLYLVLRTMQSMVGLQLNMDGNYNIFIIQK